MVMWIVLGGLIGVVVIFLIVTTILDKKKAKKVKLEKETLNKEIIEAGTNVSKEVVKIIKTNDRNVRYFVPSVGKLKMSDINKQAKDGLKDIRNSKNFKLLKHNTEQFETFSSHFNALINEKSNNWSKRNVEDIKFFEEYKAPKEETEDTKDKKGSKSSKDKKTSKSSKSSKEDTKAVKPEAPKKETKPAKAKKPSKSAKTKTESATKTTKKGKK